MPPTRFGETAPQLSSSTIELPWPRPGDKLLKPGGSAQLFGFTLQSWRDIGLIAEGYKSAGDAIIERLVNHGRNDALVMPALNCYRNYIELKLKSIIQILGLIEDDGSTYDRIHNLKTLWQAAKVGMVRHIDDDAGDDEALRVVEECVMEMHRVDEAGVGFRYPEGIDLDQVDLGNLAQVMEKVANFLGGSFDYLEDLSAAS